MLFIPGLVATCYTLLLSSRAIAYAVPFGRSDAELSQSSFTTPLSPRADDFYLRIMPLGASITRGDPADPNDPDKNGYRKFLRDRLRFDGWKVNMVGSVSSFGNMNDRDNEGWPGYKVDGVRGKASTSVPKYQPNVIAINVGTNDGQQDGSGGAPDDMERLLDECFENSRGTVVLLSTLLPNGNAQQVIKEINTAYRNIVSRRQGDGQKILLAEMDDGFITLDDIWDGIHPTKLGAQKMAAVWFNRIQEAEQRGWLQPPNDVDFDDGDATFTCGKVRASGASDPRGSPQVLFASDSTIRDDGTYTHRSTNRGSIHTRQSGGGDLNYYFAQLFTHGSDRGTEIDEIIRVGESSLSAEMAINRGDGTFDAFVPIDVKFDCRARGIRWGDVNNDGLDDFICVTPNGDLLVSINRGSPNGMPTFEYLGTHKLPVGSQYKQANVRLGDIDGDGRLDYCVIGDSDGHVRCWRNGGIGDKAAYWQDLGQGEPVFYAQGMGDIRGVRFADVNGDGRADWTWTSTSGSVTTFINQRDDGLGMKPYWREAGVTHPGQPEGTGESRENIQFARIYGSGRRDYVYIKRGDCSSGGSCGVELRVWENTGSGGMYQKGDGIRWGDLRNRGLDDYIWIDPEGVVNVYPNLNSRSDTSRYGQGSGGSPWGGARHAVLRTGLNRRALHVADWDGDGKADIVGVNNIDFSITVWKNNWDGTNFNFVSERIAGGPYCQEKRGLGYNDQSVHIADISGEGRADLICMVPSGQAFAWINDGTSSMRSVSQIKFSQDLDRANFQFADVDGNGRADLIHTDKFTGNGRVWYNMGEQPESERTRLSGSIFEWAESGVLYNGWTRGPNQQFASLQGQGRADLIKINPRTGHAWVSFNTCPGGGDDVEDGESIPDPQLPEYVPGDEPEEGEDDDEGGDGDDEEEEEGEDGGNEDGASVICGISKSAYTSENWRSLNVGDWFVERTRTYSQSGWPDVGSSGGVPAAIASYGESRQDNIFTWPATCRQIIDTCDVDNSQLQCEEAWQRSFVLWSLENFARYLQLLYSSFRDGALIASLDLAQMSLDFINRDESDILTGEAAWLTLFAGVMTSIGSVVPGVGSQGANLAAGILTTAAGAASGASDAIDMRFDDWAALSASFGDIVTETAGGFVDYYDRLLRQIPDSGNIEAGTELARLVENGAFADDTITLNETVIDMDNQKKAIQAAVINMLWREQQMFIVQVPRGKLIEIGGNRPLQGDPFSYDPCFGVGAEGDYADILGNKIYCTDTDNWFIVNWNPTEFFDYFSTSLDDLRPYGLTRELIVETSRQTQDQMRGFDVVDKDAVVDHLSGLAENAQDIDDIGDMIRFNLPVCDISNIEILTSDLRYGCYEQVGGGGIGPGTWELNWGSCFRTLVRELCSRYSTYGNAWPYELR